MSIIGYICSLYNHIVHKSVVYVRTGLPGFWGRYDSNKYYGLELWLLEELH